MRWPIICIVIAGIFAGLIVLGAGPHVQAALGDRAYYLALTAFGIVAGVIGLIVGLYLGSSDDDFYL